LNEEPDFASSREGTRSSVITLLHQFSVTIGRLALSLYAIFFASILFSNPTGIYRAEVQALESIRRGFDGSITSLILPELPAWVNILVSILAAIWLAILQVREFSVLIESWIQVARCAWRRSIWSFLGCLWQTIWVLLRTIFYIVVWLFVLILVIVNILALISVLV
jgi:hypothetical protein